MVVYLAYEYHDLLGVYSNAEAARAHVDSVREEYNRQIGYADRSGMIKVVECEPKDEW